MHHWWIKEAIYFKKQTSPDEFNTLALSKQLVAQSIAWELVKLGQFIIIFGSPVLHNL